jgi:hypothetical protein
MRTFAHLRERGERDEKFFQIHPLSATFSLIASLLLALLVILLFTLSAH